MNLNVHVWENVGTQDLQKIGSEFKDLITKPAVIILSGVVGAGKTTFVKSLIGEVDVQSPTYSVINDFGDILHADFYRIKTSEELVHLELDLYSHNKELILVEWGIDYIEDIMYFLDPSEFSYYELKINLEDNQKRGFVLSEI